jgi:hypothetical protein
MTRGIRPRRKDDQMNAGTSSSGRRRRGPGVLAAALAAIALLAAACGGSSAPTAAAQTAYQKAVAYSQCMRAHGVPNFPDPDSKGNVLITPADHLAQGAPQFVSANKTCEHLDPFTPLTPAQIKEDTAQALKFVACMRAHGITGMADPVVNAQGITSRIPAGFSPSSPVFRSAQHACQNLTPGGPP